MGQTAKCFAELEILSSEGIAELESDFVQFKSRPFRVKWLLKNLTVTQEPGILRLTTIGGGRLSLHLGEKLTERWAKKILNPPTRLEKLGIKPSHGLVFEGKQDAGFLKEVKRNPVTSLSEADFIFLAANIVDDLGPVVSIRKSMKPKAALWIVYPKGVLPIREEHVLQAGRAAGLKDVKVVRFSETDTALKFVIPVADRPPA